MLEDSLSWQQITSTRRMIFHICLLTSRCEIAVWFVGPNWCCMLCHNEFFPSWILYSIRDYRKFGLNAFMTHLLFTMSSNNNNNNNNNNNFYALQLLRAKTNQPTAFLTSLSPKTEMKDDLPTLGMTILSMSISPAGITARNQWLNKCLKILRWYRSIPAGDRTRDYCLRYSVSTPQRQAFNISMRGNNFNKYVRAVVSGLVHKLPS